jgi:hypothetical protein
MSGTNARDAGLFLLEKVHVALGERNKNAFGVEAFLDLFHHVKVDIPDETVASGKRAGTR